MERDEHRHIAFGVRFLKDAVEQDPRYGEIVEDAVAELVPRAAHVFVPPYADAPREFISYGYNSREIYGYAYRSAEAAHGRDRPGVPAGRGAHAGPDRGARRAARRSSLRARRSTGSPR